jgi:hypothetical protein
MTIDFPKDPGSGKTCNLDLNLTNSSPAAGPSSGTLVGFAFNEPLDGNGSEAVSLLNNKQPPVLRARPSVREFKPRHSGRSPGVSVT